MQDTAISDTADTEARSAGAGGLVERAKRAAYLFVISIVTSFLVALFVVMLIETLGPSDTSDGRVIDRIEGSRQVTRCATTTATRCYDTTYPTFSVIGERTDGTTWIVVGEGAYDAMRGERGVIQVSTSPITGLVVQLVGQDARDSEWTTAGSGVVWFSIGALAIWTPLLVIYENRRRGGFFKLGTFVRSDLVFAVIGIIIGLGGLWWVTWSKTASIDVATSAEIYGDFLADPLSFLAEAEEGSERIDQPGIQTGEFFEAGRNHRLATVAIDQLGSVPTVPVGTIAIPLLRIPDSTPGNDRLVFTMVDLDGNATDAIACPPTLLPFPSQLGVDRDVTGGLVCFPADAAGATLTIQGGTGVWATRTTPDYEVLPTP